ncbi:MAG: hypothetical protein WEB57_10520 [Pseudohongiellaceae bacterium]
MMTGTGMAGGHFVWLLLVALLVIVPVWRICQRAGYSGWLSLLAIVPLLNLGLLYFLAFGPWPALEEKTGDDRDQQ